MDGTTVDAVGGTTILLGGRVLAKAISNTIWY